MTMGAEKEMRPVRILLVDDHVLFRKGLLSLLSLQKGVEVVGESGDALGALKKAKEVMPDLILMDIKMPGHDGIEATRWIKEEMPHVKVIMLTVSAEEKDLFEAIKSGAQGYLLKNLEPEELMRLIQGVFKGEAALSPTMATKILREFSRGGAGEEQVSLPAVHLTEREKEVLQLVAKGETNREISLRLDISESTARNHLHNILEKLHLHNRVQAALYAVRHGVVGQEAPAQGAGPGEGG